MLLYPVLVEKAVLSHFFVCEKYIPEEWAVTEVSSLSGMAMEFSIKTDDKA